MTPAHVFLDLDGTLTDSQEGITRSIAHALRAVGRTPPAEAELVRYVGPPLIDSFAAMLGDRAAAEAALGHYRERYQAVGLFENRLYEGVAEALDALSAAGLALHLATAKPHAYASRIVAHFGLDRWLARVFGPELDGTRNDKRDLLAHALAETGADPARSVMVGDRDADVLAAKANGVRAIGTLWGYGGAAELTAAGADVLIAAPGELARHVLAPRSAADA